MDCLLNFCRPSPPREPTRVIGTNYPTTIPSRHLAMGPHQLPTAPHQLPTAPHIPRVSNTIVVGIDFGIFHVPF